MKVQRSKDCEGGLKVTTRVVGQKISKIILSDSSLTQEVPISDQEAESVCIDDATALKLASFGLTLMKANDGKPVDVEWAVIGVSSTHSFDCCQMLKFCAIRR